ncbi:unnamed protein product, partial [Mesorhabditis spiculigera]
MDWRSYIDDQLVGSGSVTKAAIVGLDGAIWAKSDHFNIGDDEAAAAAQGFVNSETLYASGLKFEGIKYMIIKADHEQIFGKKGTGGFAASKTKKAVIISIYDGTIQPGNCALTTQRLADYLIENDY